MKKTRSQIMAIILAVLNTLIVIPAILGVASSVLLFTMILDRNGSRESFYLGSMVIGIWIVGALGIIQYIGYIRHSFSSLSRQRSLKLWISTIIYNGLMVIANLVIIGLFISDQTKDYSMLVYLGFHFLFCVTAICLSVVSLRDELKRVI